MLALDSGRLAMQGTPHEVFADERKIRAIQLDTPFSMKMGDFLHQHGVEVEKHLTMEGLVKELCQYRSNM